MQIIKQSFISLSETLKSFITTVLNKKSNICLSYNGESIITTQVILTSTIDLELI